MTDWKTITRHISDATGRPFKPGSPRHVGGGCINTSVRLSDRELHFFVKLNRSDLLDMFAAEAAALQQLRATRSVRVPRTICFGVTQDQAYLVLEYIELSGNGDSEAAGRQLAALHRASWDRFGWQRDNTIGSTPQPNTPTTDWIEFWRRQRLGFQLQLAAKNGYLGRLQQRGEILLQEFSPLIDHRPSPSLIHGDLWGGNLGYDGHRQPVIYDPAVYYADREAELAMTELFGGFGGRFYDAYNTAWPLNAGYRTRKTLYNLYHALNHLNLFGGGYAAQALDMIDRLLAELGH
jgi:fructosamine-3-kinase